MQYRAIAGLALLLMSAAVPAAVNSPQRVRAFAAQPDWSGLWETDNAAASAGTADTPKGYGDPALLKLSGHPPYNAEWEAKAKQKNPLPPPDFSLCAFGFPAMMDSPVMFMMSVLPEETVMLFHGDDVRHIYTDGRPHPPVEDLWPTPVGDSVGHWEGDTLVVDTIARKAGRIYLNPQYEFSDQVHFTERVRMAGKDALENDMTIDDPVAFIQPWQLKLRYKRVKDLDRLMYQNCDENERNIVIDGQHAIAPASNP